MNVLMVAAENGAIPGGKVGGIGDVIRDIPVALAGLGHRVNIVTPGYQRFCHLPGARRVGAVDVLFRGVGEHVEIFELPSQSQGDRVRCWALEHPLFAPCGSGRIYCDDPPGSPFAQDASKFALFSVAVAQAVIEHYWGRPDVIHLHDWHAALVLLLARFAPWYRQLGDSLLVYSIHNLALQGIRPLSGHHSSLEAWFPGLEAPQSLVGDPRYGGCLNPMRLAINLADKVQAVSPTYAREIQAPSNPAMGFYGGEGLEDDLRRAAAEGRLVGILNGSEYPDEPPQCQGLGQLLVAAERQLLHWLAGEGQARSSHIIALRTLDSWRQNGSAPADFLVTSVGRITAQKVQLLLAQSAAANVGANNALGHILSLLSGRGRLIMIGSGDPALEAELLAVAARHDNFLFLNGFSETLAEPLYQCGDLFLMPSSFEPCGISQMLAMRAGQPCLVHHVGGLVDTVIDNHNGFAFNGTGQDEQVAHLVQRMAEILALHQHQPEHWQAIRTNARNARFLWSSVAGEYLEKLYVRA